MSLNNNNDDKEILENEIIKKQKLDNGGDIEISNLKQNKVNKLKEIADSMGIQLKLNVKKQDLIDKITFLINKKQEIIKQKEIDDNVNSFNKEIVEFKIKDGVKESEWLFWKIFRNKVIYKKIMSFMDTHISQTYESITSVEKMIDSNQLYMLRDKVIRNQYLVFYSTTRNKSDNACFNIFNYFKKDKLFYKSFFKNYNKNINGFNRISDASTREYEFKYGRILSPHDFIINKLIDSKNYLALYILIQDYKFIPTNGNLGYSIKNGKLKFMKFLLLPIFNLQIQIFEINFSIHQQPVNPNIYKTLNYLFKEKLIDSNFLQTNFYSTLSINEKTTLKQLLSIVLFIKNSTTDTLVKDQQKFNQTFSFKKEELKFEITNPALSNHKQSLKLLIEFYYKFGKSVKSNDEIPITDLFYHLYLCDNESVIVHKLNNFSTLDSNQFNYYLQISLQCGTFKTLNHVLKYSNTFNNQQLQEFILSNYLFAFCKKDKEKQIQFINEIMKISKQTSRIIIKDEDFIRFLIIYDDLELIKLFSNGIKISTIQNITSLIKSIEILDYLFKDYYILISNNIFSFNNIQLFNHFQELYKFGKIELSSNYLDQVIIISNCSKEIFIQIISNGSKLYKIQTIESLYKVIQKFKNNFSNQEIFKMCKLIFLNYQLIYRHKLQDSFIDLESTFGFIKFIDWLFINYNKELYELFPNFIQQLLFRTGRYNNPNLNNNNNKEISILKIIDFLKPYENIKLVDYCLNRLESCTTEQFQNQVGKFVIKEILRSTVINGRLKSFEHIYQNYNWVFSRKATKNGYLIDLKELKSLLLTSLYCGYQELSELLLQIVPITQNEFLRSASDLSIFYFKHKLLIFNTHSPAGKIK